MLRRNPGLAPFLLSRFAYVIGATGSPVLLTLTTLGASDSLSSLAVVLGAGALHAVAGAFVSKWLSDRLSARGLLALTAGLWVLAAGITGAWFAVAAVPVAWLCAVSFVIELSAALQYPSLGSYLPQVVADADLGAANSARSFTTGLAGILGPVLFAFTGGLVPVSLSWLLLAGVMVISALPLARLPREQAFEADGLGVWKDMRAGWSYFWSCRGLWTVVVVSGIWHLFGWSALTVVGPVVLRNQYDDLRIWGWLQAALAAGSLIGALVAARVSVQRVAAWALASLAPAMVLAGLLSVHAAVIWLLVLAGVTGASLSIGSVLWASAVQREVPRARMSQVFSYDYLFSEAINPIGLLMIPALVAAAGGEITLLRTASVAILALIVTAAVTAPKRLAHRPEPSTTREPAP